MALQLWMPFTKDYRNNGLVYTSPSHTGGVPAGDYFWGAWKTYDAQNYRGYMQGMKVYTKVLTQAEITEIYNKGYK